MSPLSSQDTCIQRELRPMSRLNIFNYSNLTICNGGRRLDSWQATCVCLAHHHDLRISNLSVVC